MNKIICKSLEELPQIANTIVEAHADKRLFAFKGSMGAGKTTLIKAVCADLKVKDTVNSPTFSIVNEYFTESGNSVFHFDFYRIKKVEEVMDIGYEDYLYSGNYCFMEWPELIEELLPENVVYIHIEEDLETGNRIVSY